MLLNQALTRARLCRLESRMRLPTCLWRRLSMATFMKPGEDVKHIDKGIKNKWRWAWLEDLGVDGKPFSSWCQKLPQPGVCYCTLCRKKLVYGTSGKKMLPRHEQDAFHKAAARSVQYTSRLPGASATADIPPSITDRMTDLKIRLCAFIAEHDLSFTVAQPLVALCKKVAEDGTALAQLSVSRQHASYLLTHGISPEFKKRLSEKLRSSMFSLNIDEATDKNMDRIMNILVRFYDEDTGSVKTQHLASRKVNIANAEALIAALNDVLRSYGLDWRQVTSLLLDNCAVMRGKKSGLETLARKENPNLLDISGDTVHMVSNAAKALLSPFRSEVEDFCSDVYYDIEKSPKQKEIFSQFQSLLHIPRKNLMRPISNRFIQMLEVCNRMNELLDAVVLHYYHVIDPNEEHRYR